MAKKEVGHNFLARLGKKRLRPGGITATNWLIEQGGFSQDTKVLEVACNMCTTSIELASKYHAQIIGIDLDQSALEKAKKNIRAAGLEAYIQVQQGNALKLPFEDNTFDIVINEAMLTMLNQQAKEKAVREYLRVLKPGGKLLTHDVAYTDSGLAEVLAELKKAINMNVAPLHVDAWTQLFKDAGFSKVNTSSGEMTLMSVKGMLKDEGLVNTLRIVKNGRKPENREMFKKMRQFFTKTGKDLRYIAVCSTK